MVNAKRQKRCPGRAELLLSVVRSHALCATLSIALLVSCVAVFPTFAQEKTTGKDSKAADAEKGAAKTGEEEGEEEEEEKGLQIGKLLPLNKPNLRVKIPGFDNGELKSMVEAEKLTRIDDTNFWTISAVSVDGIWAAGPGGVAQLMNGTNE